MSHIMLDLETLGTKPGCIILSIGAVVFSPKYGLGAEFNRIISTKSCVAAGLISEADTVAWWGRQEPKAKEVLAQARCEAAWDLRRTLADFALFIAANGGKVDARIWGNGSDFDNVILAHAYAAVNAPLPWKYYRNRCYRTLKSFAPALTADEREGVHHDALADAKHQARHAIKLLQKMATSVTPEAVKTDAVEQRDLGL